MANSDPHPTPSLGQTRVAPVLVAIALALSTLLTAAYWEELTRPFDAGNGLLSPFGKVPLAGVVKIGGMTGFLVLLSMLIAIPVSGRLIKRLDKSGIETDPPMDNVRATKSLSDRVIELEESQKASLEIQEETQEAIVEILEKMDKNGR